MSTMFGSGEAGVEEALEAKSARAQSITARSIVKAWKDGPPSELEWGMELPGQAGAMDTARSAAAVCGWLEELADAFLNLVDLN